MIMKSRTKHSLSEKDIPSFVAVKLVAVKLVAVKLVAAICAEMIR
jgi:hypothetical protein